MVCQEGENAERFAEKLVYDLRKKGISAETELLGRSVKAQMKYADKIGARYSVIIGDDEISDGVLKLKNMQTGETKNVSADEIDKEIV